MNALQAKILAHTKAQPLAVAKTKQETHQFNQSDAGADANKHQENAPQTLDFAQQTLDFGFLSTVKEAVGR